MEPVDYPIREAGSETAGVPSVSTHSPTTPASPSPNPSQPPPGPAAPRKRSRSYLGWLGAAVLVGGSVVAGAFFATQEQPDPGSAATVVAAPTTTTTVAADLTGSPAIASNEAPEVQDQITAVLLDASMVGDSVIPSVVTVQIVGTAGNGRTGILGSGSGVIYDNSGHILTNDHVVSAGSDYEVVLSNGTIYPAELVGTDPTTDLAVLRVSATGLKPIELGATDSLTVGDPAVAVGSPLGLDGGPSLTVGVVSAFGREVRTNATTTLYGMLQTDAPITQGSSGGALVDGSGRLVGITTAVGVSDVGIEGIGFATPVEIVERVANEIIAGGSASRPYIGILGITTFADTTDGGSAPIGVLIDSVEPDTGAAAAGLAQGDVIAAVDDTPVKTMDELVALLREYGSGSTINVTLDGGAIVAVTLGQNPG